MREVLEGQSGGRLYYLIIKVEKLGQDLVKSPPALALPGSWGADTCPSPSLTSSRFTFHAYFLLQFRNHTNSKLHPSGSTLIANGFKLELQAFILQLAKQKPDFRSQHYKNECIRCNGSNCLLNEYTFRQSVKQELRQKAWVEPQLFSIPQL